MYRWRLAAAIALCVALAAALVAVLAFNRADQGPPAAKATPSERASPSPTPSATPLVVPTPNTTGRDFERIYREIADFETWLSRHPDPELVSLIYHPECECYGLAVRSLGRLRSEGLHFQDPAFIVDSVKVVEDFPALVRIEVRVQQPAHTLVDSHGRTVQTVPSEPPTVLNIALVQVDRRWVVRTTTEIPQ